MGRQRSIASRWWHRGLSSEYDCGIVSGTGIVLPVFVPILPLLPLLCVRSPAQGDRTVGRRAIPCCLPTPVSCAFSSHPREPGGSPRASPCSSWVEHRWSGWKYSGVTGAGLETQSHLWQPKDMQPFACHPPCLGLPPRLPPPSCKLLLLVPLGLPTCHSERVRWEDWLLACASRRPNTQEREAAPQLGS